MWSLLIPTTFLRSSTSLGLEKGFVRSVELRGSRSGAQTSRGNSGTGRRTEEVAGELHLLLHASHYGQQLKRTILVLVAPVAADVPRAYTPARRTGNWME